MSKILSDMLVLRYHAGIFLLAVTSGYEMECPPGTKTTGPWVMPGTLCRSYYTCTNSHPIIHYCPSNTFFDTESKNCGITGSCYEAVCSGREDGRYLDPTESCTRSYWCLGGRLVRVGPSPSNVGVCPTLHGNAAKLVHRPDRCKNKQDGRYSENDNCTGFFECQSGNEINMVTCPSGTLFNGDKCSIDATGCLNICSAKNDGLYPDPHTDCSQYVKCSKGIVAERLTCPANTAFNSLMCVPQETFFCPETDPCRSLPDGFHLESCEEYYKCEKMHTLFSAVCPRNEYFSGLSCVPKGLIECRPPYFSKICLGKDGYFTNHTSDCSAYYYCNREGKKIDFVCAENYIFNGSVCVSKGSYFCPKLFDSCEDKLEGYYFLNGSRCQAYYYCLNGNKITYYCPKGMLYNGNECVPASSYTCNDDIICNDIIDRT